MNKQPERWLALDAIRGFTVAAMIIVNTPGSSEAVYPVLRHANWNGMTPTDLIFPFFLFMVGMSIALAYGRHSETGHLPRGLWRKIGSRGGKIYLIGLFLSLWPRFDLERIRFVGVLPRIAVVFVSTALLFLLFRRNWRALSVVTAIALTGYWVLLVTVPVPRDTVIEEAIETGKIRRGHRQVETVRIEVSSTTSIAPNLEPGTNLSAWIDRRWLPGARYERTWDPEGLLSTIPAIGTALLGVVTGLVLLRGGRLKQQLIILAGGGALCASVGYAWAVYFPLNKNLWTSSFALVSAGWTMIALGLAAAMIDGLRWRRWAWPGFVLGGNAITAYVLATLGVELVSVSWWGSHSPRQLFMDSVEVLGCPSEMASLGFALSYTAVIFYPIYLLHRRHLFIRL